MNIQKKAVIEDKATRIVVAIVKSISLFTEIVIPVKKGITVKENIRHHDRHKNRNEIKPVPT